MPDEKADKYQPEGLTSKVVKFVCCGQTWCQECWENCWQEPEQEHRISKDDIHPVIISHQPITRLDSAASHSSIGSYSGASTYSAPYSPGIRDRVDSDSSSRKGSMSSNPDFKMRGNPTPIIDMKPIEFWTANRETVQPRTPKRRLPSESEISIEDLKPDLYSESNDSADDCLTDEEKLARFKLGQVHFSLQYEIPVKCLIVRLIEARDLPLPFSHDANRQDMAHSNPYAKLCLLPDQKNSQQTSVQRKTQDPEWNEQFKFELPFKEVQRRTLEITVKDFDKYSRHCVIGQLHLPLDGINLIKGGHMWKPLLPSNKENTDLGEILLSLNYLPSAGRLNVDVIKGKQLLQTDLIGGSDPFVKVTLCYGLKSMKTRKTSVKKNTIDPVFNESISFNVTPEQLQHCSLVVTVWDYNSKSKDDFVGRIVMGKNATGPYEITHWNRMLQCQRSPVAQWHTLLSMEECEAKFPLNNALT